MAEDNRGVQNEVSDAASLPVVDVRPVFQSVRCKVTRDCLRVGFIPTDARLADFNNHVVGVCQLRHRDFVKDDILDGTEHQRTVGCGR